MAPERDERYIGDGVYARWERGMIRLRTERDDGAHIIFVDPEVWRALTAMAIEGGWVQ